MSAKIQRIKYFHAMIEDRPGETFSILSKLRSQEVNLLAFNAVPTSATHCQLTLYPENADSLVRMAEKSGFPLYGPHNAFLITGDDRLGALVEIHRMLCDSDINVVTSSGISDGKGGFGYILHVRENDFERVADLLGV